MTAFIPADRTCEGARLCTSPATESTQIGATRYYHCATHQMGDRTLNHLVEAVTEGWRADERAMLPPVAEPVSAEPEASHPDLTGQRFGKLVAVARRMGRGNRPTNTYDCRCDCGRVVEKNGWFLTRGTVKSCGRRCALRGRQPEESATRAATRAAQPADLLQLQQQVRGVAMIVGGWSVADLTALGERATGCGDLPLAALVAATLKLRRKV